MKHKIQIINGPNLNLLGKREPEIYGDKSFESFFEILKNEYADIDLLYFQSNHEGYLIDKLHEIGFDFDGIILNAGALTHYSYSIADAIKAIEECKNIIEEYAESYSKNQNIKNEIKPIKEN